MRRAEDPGDGRAEEARHRRGLHGLGRAPSQYYLRELRLRAQLVGAEDAPPAADRSDNRLRRPVRADAPGNSTAFPAKRRLNGDLFPVEFRHRQSAVSQRHVDATGHVLHRRVARGRSLEHVDRDPGRQHQPVDHHDDDQHVRRPAHDALLAVHARQDDLRRERHSGAVQGDRHLRRRLSDSPLRGLLLAEEAAPRRRVLGADAQVLVGDLHAVHRRLCRRRQLVPLPAFLLSGTHRHRVCTLIRVAIGIVFCSRSSWPACACRGWATLWLG